jgi:hypothetical protein
VGGRQLAADERDTGRSSKDGTRAEPEGKRRMNGDELQFWKDTIRDRNAEIAGLKKEVENLEANHARLLADTTTRVTQQGEQIRMLIEADKTLRRLLCLRHGCPVEMLYGDDGELQCSACFIDFKRMTADDIETQLRGGTVEVSVCSAHTERTEGCEQCSATVTRDMFDAWQGLKRRGVFQCGECGHYVADDGEGLATQCPYCALTLSRELIESEELRGVEMVAHAHNRVFSASFNESAKLAKEAAKRALVGITEEQRERLRDMAAVGALVCQCGHDQRHHYDETTLKNVSDDDLQYRTPTACITCPCKGFWPVAQ